MTLQEKFQEEPVVVYQESFILTNQSAEQLVEIAEEFAIGFAEWCVVYCNPIFPNKNEWIHNKTKKAFATQELLEIYKKEKGL